MNQIDSETVSFAPDDAVLVLEDGQVYVGDSYGAIGKTTGEIVFATGMTGYQETLTDPSYDRQIVVQTFPHIGDTGINREDPESSRIWVAGYVVRDLAKNGIVGLSHIDTRKLVRHLRSAGVMRAGIFSGDALLDDEGRLKTVAALIDEVKATPQMKGLSLYDEVSTKETYTVEPCGEYEGKEPLELLRKVLDAGYPFFGICFGNQLLGRALGFGTYKLKFGHRGINQPVKDLTTGKVEVTAHNHGFAVDAPIGETIDAPFDNGHFGKVFVSHIDLNDDVVEGLQCVDIPAFSVQYHPEAAAGPHDAAYLFDRFVDLMKTSKEENRNA